jgi:hypothetical protein
MEKRYEFQQLYDKVLSDSAFRLLLVADPKAALKQLKIQPTTEVLKAIETIIADLEKLEALFGHDKCLFAP